MDSGTDSGPEEQQVGLELAELLDVHLELFRIRVGLHMETPPRLGCCRTPSKKFHLLLVKKKYLESP